MSDDEKKDEEAPKGFTSTDAGADSNKEVGATGEPEGQTPDQFYNPEVERAKADENIDPKHATKGMTSLGYTEASRIEDTTAFQEQERKTAEKAAAKKEKD